MLSMKNLLVIFCLAMCLLADVEYEDSEAGNLKKINDIRREFAKKHNIANMHELALDRNLRQTAMHMDIQYPTWQDEAGKTWRYTWLGELFSHESFKKWQKSFMEKTDDEVKEEMKKKKPDSFAELVVPKQKTIGCAAKDANGGALVLHMCLYGPEKHGTVANNPIGGGASSSDTKADENSGPCNFSFFKITAVFSMIMLF